jgi:uncharacterized protein YpmS
MTEIKFDEFVEEPVPHAVLQTEDDSFSVLKSDEVVELPKPAAKQTFRWWVILIIVLSISVPIFGLVLFFCRRTRKVEDSEVVESRQDNKGKSCEDVVSTSQVNLCSEDRKEDHSIKPMKEQATITDQDVMVHYTDD